MSLSSFLNLPQQYQDIFLIIDFKIGPQDTLLSWGLLLAKTANFCLKFDS